MLTVPICNLGSSNNVSPYLFATQRPGRRIRLWTTELGGLGQDVSPLSSNVSRSFHMEMMGVIRRGCFSVYDLRFCRCPRSWRSVRSQLIFDRDGTSVISCCINTKLLVCTCAFAQQHINNGDQWRRCRARSYSPKGPLPCAIGRWLDGRYLYVSHRTCIYAFR